MAAMVSIIGMLGGDVRELQKTSAGGSPLPGDSTLLAGSSRHAPMAVERQFLIYTGT